LKLVWLFQKYSLNNFKSETRGHVQIPPTSSASSTRRIGPSSMRAALIAAGIFPFVILFLFYYSFTLLLFYSFTLLLFYSFTLLLFYSFTLSIFHSFTLSLFHSFTLSLFHSFTLLLFHSFTLSPFHSFTLSLLHHSTLYSVLCVFFFTFLCDLFFFAIRVIYFLPFVLCCATLHSFWMILTLSLFWSFTLCCVSSLLFPRCVSTLLAIFVSRWYRNQHSALTLETNLQVNIYFGAWLCLWVGADCVSCAQRMSKELKYGANDGPR
jgi:hypothetical protein